MALPSGCVLVFTLSLFMPAMVSSQQQQPILNPDEQESVYRVLESVNSDIPWRSLFPDDLCSSAPHGVVCDFYGGGDDDNSTADTLHITELSFGYVSDYSMNPPCTPNSTLSPTIFTFKYLRKLFFYGCFTGTQVSPPPIPPSFGSYLEELVLVENPSLAGSLAGVLGNYSRLRRVILTGTGLNGEIPEGIGSLPELEQITLARNRLAGELPRSLGDLKKLRVLDLSHNGFQGNVPDSIGRLSRLLKLDLSSNRFEGKIPETMKDLQELEILDLSYNGFANFGVPLFLAEMPRLREVHLSGNPLGGQIPEIWEKLGDILGIGFSGVGLVGNIPASMGVFLRNMSYLGLDNNRLEGTVPPELGFLDSINEMNLENNMLSGRLPFSSKFTARIGEKLKLAGNPELCVDEGLSSAAAKNGISSGHLKFCSKPHIPDAALFSGSSSIHQASHLLLLLLGFFSVFSFID
ncbi:piriformospora indica-insensitive protein 2 [Malania oleifera]|uniref:piriformospora indica-insensitive protein 2 n=1 Tax=Malania oleifera TaxID=397392 RepID=UPI0025ADDE25|nr:piriformospora indica-insensitive protein 2 [Malania oleifera]